jgi:RNA polymerase sigma-70 factor (ECF subfamily)
MIEDSDEALMRGIAAGDETALRALAERHLDRMRRLARKTLGNDAEADDVAQDALIRVWSHAASWRPERARLSTWLYTIVWRLCVDRLRTLRTLPLERAMQVEDPAPGAFETLAQASDLDRLATAMQALQPRQRAALTLFYYEEMTGPDAAEVLGLSLRAFWSLLHRARQTVQQHMTSPAPGQS